MGDDLNLAEASGPAVGAPTAEAGAPEVGAAEVDALAAQALELAEPDPRRALALAEAVDRWPEPGEVSMLARGLAAWAAGRASRHLGRHRAATVALETAVQLLGASGDRVAAARASVSLSTERIDAGRFDDAIALLDTAAKELSGGDAARAAAQKALVLQRSGRVIDTVEDWDRAVKAFEVAGMPVQAAQARQNRGLVQAYRGELAAAEEDLVAAAATFSLHGEDIRGAEVLHDRGFVAARRGDLPGALALFDRAQSRSAELGALRPEMLVDRVEVCLRAGLNAEGRALAEAAVRALEEAGFAPDVPEACLLAARACEQDGDPAASAEWARRAVTLFRAQRRPRWQLLARYAVVRAEAAAGRPGVGMARRLLAVGEALRRAGWAAEAEEAEVRGAEVLIGAARLEEAGAVLARLAPGVARMLPLRRLQFRLCQSRLRWAAGDARGAERALLAGLGALSAYLATLGSIELRAAGGGRAGEVMSLGVTMAAARGRPARALWWMETVHAAQQVEPDGPIEGQAEGPVEGPGLAAALASLRDVMALLAREPTNPRETTALRQRQAVLEEVVRRTSRHAAGTRAPERYTARAAALREALGPRLLVEYAPVGRHLVAVVLDGGRCRLFELAPLAEVREAVAGLRLALRTALDADPPTEDQPALREAAADVQRLVLGAPRPTARPGGGHRPRRARAADAVGVVARPGHGYGGGGGVGAEPLAPRVYVHAQFGESQGRRPGRPGPAPRRGGDRGGGRALGRGGRGAKGRGGQRGRGHERHEPRSTSSTSPLTAPSGATTRYCPPSASPTAPSRATSSPGPPGRPGWWSCRAATAAWPTPAASASAGSSPGPVPPPSWPV